MHLKQHSGRTGIYPSNCVSFNWTFKDTSHNSIRGSGEFHDTRETKKKKKKGQETCEKWVRGVVPKLHGWEVLLQFGDQMWGRGGEGGRPNSSRQRLPNASWSKSLAKTARAEASHLRPDDTSIGVDGKLTVRSQRAPKALWTTHYVAEQRVNLGRDDVCVGVCGYFWQTPEVSCEPFRLPVMFNMVSVVTSSSRVQMQRYSFAAPRLILHAQVTKRKS